MQAHTGALHDLANSTQQRNYDHIFASIPVYDGSSREDFFLWLERLETACYHCETGYQNRSIRKVSWTCPKCHNGPSSETNHGLQ